ncbi:hypothetical protein TELCIR_25530, partial [Teladorsagia circumcincta]
SRSSSTHSSDSERSHKRRRSRRSVKRRDSLERAQNDLPQCQHPCLVCEKPQKSVSFAQPESTIAQRHGVLKKTSRYDEPTEQPETSLPVRRGARSRRPRRNAIRCSHHGRTHSLRSRTRSRRLSCSKSARPKHIGYVPIRSDLKVVFSYR